MNRVREKWNPAYTTIAFVVGIAAAAALLVLVTRLGADTDQHLVESPRFKIWIAVAAFAMVAFVDTLLAGVRELRGGRGRSTAPSLAAYGWLFVLFAAVVVAVLRLGGRGGPPVHVQYWGAITFTLLVLGAAASGPWVVSVWATHATLSRSRADIARLSAGSVDEPAGSEHLLHLLLDLRKNIVASVGRLLVLVLGAVLLSGALHAALVPTFITEDDFPASAVLLYGAFFTVVLSLAVVPLLLAWRRTAMLLLDQARPMHVTSTADDVADRERLAQILGLNGSLFTWPVALTGLLTPLVTSLVAVFIPQLGS